MKKRWIWITLVLALLVIVLVYLVYGTTTNSLIVLANYSQTVNISSTGFDNATVNALNRTWLKTDGSTGFITCGTDILGSLTTFSISMWVNVTSIPSGAITPLFYANSRPYIAWNTNNAIRYNTNAVAIDTPILDPGQWYYIMATYNGSFGQLYLNGTQVANGTDTLASNSQCLFMTGFSRFINGSIDEVRIYNRTLNSTEVGLIYNSGRKANSSLSENGLILWYALNENSGTVAYDLNGNYDGTITGPLWMNDSISITLINGTDYEVNTTNGTFNLTNKDYDRSQLNITYSYLELPPTEPNITAPINGTTLDGTIHTEWIGSTDPNSDFGGDYNVTVRNITDSSLVYWIGFVNDDTDTVWNSTNVTNGNYNLMVEACDNSGLCANATIYVTINNIPLYDLDTDNYNSTLFSGNDCYDSLQSYYINSTSTCNSTTSPVFLESTGDDDGTNDIFDHTWIQDSSGVYHLFFQWNVTSSNTDIVHFNSTDLTSINLVGPALYKNTSAYYDSLWAPHIIKNGSTYYMYFTGVERPGNPWTERIGLATSTDLDTWTLYPINNCPGTVGLGCVYDCNASWTEWPANDTASDMQCRDPMVIRDDENDRWLMFITARVNNSIWGYADSQVITVANSSDLINWDDLGFLRETTRYPSGSGAQGTQTTGGVAENPFVTSYNGSYYLFFADTSDNEANGSVIQYLRSPTLYVNSSGSSNWEYMGHIPDYGINAMEIQNLYNDTWIMSQSIYSTTSSDNALHNRDLRLKRINWSSDGSFTTLNLTDLDCRIASSAINPGGTDNTTNGADEDCSGLDYDGIYPNISIISPTNTTYTTATILTNISTADDIGVDTVWYSWNNTNVTYTSVLNITYGEGSNTLYAWVNDTYGNVNSSSVSFTVNTSGSSGDTSSGGGGSNKIVISDVELKEGYRNSIYSNIELLFRYGDESHLIKILKKDVDYVTLEVTSTPVTFNMSVGDIYKIDLDDDGYYDIRITLFGISTKIDLEVIEINEEIVSTEPPGPSIISAGAVDNITTEERVAGTITNRNNVLIYGFIVFVLVIVIYLVTAKLKKEKNKSHKK